MANTKTTIKPAAKPTVKKETAAVSDEAKEKLSELIATDAKPAKLNLEDTTQGIKISDDTLVDVKSNCFGELLYKGKDGSTSWSKCGEMQSLTMRELREMKSTAPKFFESQWIVIMGVSTDSSSKAKPADIYKSLGITKWYKNLVEPSSFQDICSWDEAIIATRIKLMSTGAKENLIIALGAYISSGVLDSRKKIKAFEDALGVSLTE